MEELIQQEYYIGQIFEGEYPAEAAQWCNEKNCHIEETEQSQDEIRQFKIMKNSQETEEEKAQRISMLSLTAADVERALYKAKGIDFDDVLNIVYQQTNNHSELISESDPIENISIDPKALKIELKANNFFRGNAYISKIGALLGITETQLDEFFETNDYTKLIQSAEL